MSSTAAAGRRRRSSSARAPSSLENGPTTFGAGYFKRFGDVHGFADPVPARDLDRRLPGGADGARGPGGAEPVAIGDRTPDGRLGGRVRALVSAGAVGAPLCVPVGGRDLLASAHDR